jgi:hypothetical protein
MKTFGQNGGQHVAALPAKVNFLKTNNIKTSYCQMYNIKEWE